MEEYYEFVTKSDKITIDNWLDGLDSSYAAGNAEITDELYDYIIELYENRFGKRNVVGSPPTHRPVNLPIAMMSLDKIKKDKELQSFVSKNPGGYVIMDKINGNAGLYEIKKVGNRTLVNLYNRGDGTEGADLTHVLPFLNLPILDCSAYIKGEIVVSKADYEPFKEDYKVNLSMTNGLLNSQSADPERLKLLQFVAYDIVFPDNPGLPLTMIESLTLLYNYGFKIPYNLLVNELSISWLSMVFNVRKDEAIYDVDGIVIASNRVVKYEERLIRSNPKYMIAFKEYGDTAEAIVSHVLWESSKNHYIKPVVKIYPVTINSFTIKSLTAFNAAWIVENKVGPGTKLLITHNTIPYILDVLESTEPQMPPEELYPPGSWYWNETHVDIILHEANDEVKIARIYEFFKKIEAKYLGEVTLSKFYNAGVDSVKKMLEYTREDFIEMNIKGVGVGIIDRIVNSIKTSLPKVTLPQLMAASLCFGIGFGVRKLTPVTDRYPNILDIEPTVEEIMQLEGFAEKTAERFVIGLPKFKQFLKEIPILEQVARGKLRTPVSPLPTPVSQRSPVRSPLPTPVSQRSLPTTTRSPLPTHLPIGSLPTTARSPLPIPVSPITSAPLNIQQSLSGKSIVFTGFRDKALEADIKSMGGAVKTGVSKKTDYLIVGGKKGVGSGKETKAIDYGIPVLSVAEFKSMFGL